jgi:hypothetical protein
VAVGEGVGAGVTAGVGIGAPLGAGVTGRIVAAIAVAETTPVAEATGCGVGLPGAPTPDASRSPHATAAIATTMRQANRRPMWVERPGRRKVPRPPHILCAGP